MPEVRTTIKRKPQTEQHMSHKAEILEQTDEEFKISTTNDVKKMLVISSRKKIRESQMERLSIKKKTT